MIGVIDGAILLFSLWLCLPLLLEVVFKLIVVAAIYVDIQDGRLQALGFTKYFEDCATVESCENEKVKGIMIDVFTLEQEIISAKNQ